MRVAHQSGCWSQWSEPLQLQFFEVPDAPSVAMAGSNTFCQDEEVVVSAPEGFAYYKWNTGETTRELKVKTVGEYSVQVAYEAGCWSRPSEAVSVNFNPKPPAAESGLPAVMDVCQHQYFSLSAPDGFVNYEWSNGSMTKMIEVSRPGIYSYRLKDGSNCWSDFSEGVRVNFHDYPEAAITQSGTTLTASEGVKYQWLLNRKELAETTRSIEAIEEGDYQVKVTNEYGCTTLSDAFTIGISGVADELADIRLYPNPTSGRLQLDSDFRMSRIQLFNTSGTSMLDKRIDSAEFQYDLSHFPAAIYFLHLTIGDRVVLYKIVKF